MRDLYPGYRPASEEELGGLWKTCNFAFDASALLDAYRLTPKSRDEYFWVLEKVSDRVWLPHQAGLEYYDNRIEVIETGEASYGKIPQFARGAANLFKRELDRYRQYRWIDADRWVSTLETAVEQVTAGIANEDHVLAGYPAIDPIEERLQKLFAAKVGEPYPSLYDVFTKAEQRIQLSIPPGFKDQAEKKDFHRYGDIVIWFQLLDFAKLNKKGLIFITSDTKSDWWSRDNGKTVGVRPELVQEMHIAAGVPFHMYTPNRFMEYAKLLFGSQEDAPVLEDTARELLEVQNQKAAESVREGVPATLEYDELYKGLTSATSPYADQMKEIRAALSHYGELYKGLTSGAGIYADQMEEIRAALSHYGELYKGLTSGAGIYADQMEEIRAALNVYGELYKGLASALSPYGDQMKEIKAVANSYDKAHKGLAPRANPNEQTLDSETKSSQADLAASMEEKGGHRQSLGAEETRHESDPTQQQQPGNCDSPDPSEPSGKRG